jgi:hypothetical protein
LRYCQKLRLTLRRNVIAPYFELHQKLTPGGIQTDVFG